MKHKLLLILTITLIISQLANAQKRYYEKGYVITLNGDTLKGYLRHVKHSTLLTGVDFKKDIEDSDVYKHFVPTDLQSFYFIKDNLKFEPVIYTSPNKKIVEKKFGELLVSGKLNLYRLDMLDKDNKKIFEEENDHIYIVRKDSIYTVLRMTESIVNDIYKVDKDYKKQLLKILTENETPAENGEDFEKLLFRDSQIKKVFSGNHENVDNPNKSDSNTIVYSQKYKTILKNIFTIGNENFVSDGKNSGSGFVISYLLHLFRPKELGRFSFITGLEYAQYSGGIVNSQTNSYLRIPILATYSLGQGKFEPFINLGVTTITSINDINFGFLTNLGIGTYYKDRYFISILYENSPLLSSSITKLDFFSNYGLIAKFGIKLF